MRLIIIGGVAAGTKAAAKARRVNPNADIIIYQQEAQVSYSACGEPYAISGIIKDSNQLIIRRAADFAKSGIQVCTEHRVTAIDTANKQLTICDLQNQRTFTDNYDRLIIATGARPYIPDINGVQAQGVLALRSWTEFTQFRDSLITLKPRKAVILGTGYISLELAESLTLLNISTTIIGRSRILSTFDTEMAQRVAQHLLDNGVELILGEKISEILTENNRVVGVQTKSGQRIDADIVVLATGIKPNVELAQQAGIALGTTGAIQVNETMQTSVPDIYAAGDCCETLHRISNTAIWQPLGDTANLQGRVAGENAAGSNAVFSGCLGTAILKAFDFNIAITGLSENAAKQHGFETIAVEINAINKARYYPNAKSSTLKLIADANNGRLLGAQAVGCGASDKLIDIVATALLGKLTCADLENADLAYSPPFSPTLSPVIVAAGILNSQMNKTS